MFRLFWPEEERDEVIRETKIFLQRYGDGYRYAHDEAGAVADMECLPDALQGQRFYHPTGYGWEARICDRLKEIAEARKSSK